MVVLDRLLLIYLLSSATDNRGQVDAIITDFAIAFDTANHFI